MTRSEPPAGAAPDEGQNAALAEHSSSFTCDEIARVNDVEWRGRAIGGDFDSDADRRLWERWRHHINDIRPRGWRYVAGRALSAVAAAALIITAGTSGREWLLSLTH